MSLKIYNSVTKQKELFVPINPGKANFYVCGMTVYDYCHIGHARTYITFDMIMRYLRSQGLDVTYIRNITDIDDKIIKRAHENGETIQALTNRFVDAMREDFSALSILPPDAEPKATEHMVQIIDMVQTLIDKGHAYIAKNNDVYYCIKSFKKYGQLAHKNLDDLQAGARVEVVDVKKDPLDFVLWKSAKEGEPSWDSPWGAGRPGWHIECSAMSTCALGNHFDIHGGGFDLKFPHHENEIAQSEGATGEKFVNMWIHVGFVQVDKVKMSKSLGNFFTVRDVLKSYPAGVIRYFTLSSHYRSQVNFSQENLKIAHNTLNSLYTALRGLPKSKLQPIENSDYEQRFNAAMDDDFNTPEAMAVLSEIAHEINRQREHDTELCGQLGALLTKLGDILGILQQSPDDFLHTDISDEEREQIESLIAQRQQARKTKNWAEADRVREQLTAMGVELEDSAEGSTWRKG